MSAERKVEAATHTSATAGGGDTRELNDASPRMDVDADADADGDSEHYGGEEFVHPLAISPPSPGATTTTTGDHEHPDALWPDYFLWQRFFQVFHPASSCSSAR